MKKVDTKVIDLDLLAQALGLTDRDEAYKFLNHWKTWGVLGRWK